MKYILGIIFSLTVSCLVAQTSALDSLLCNTQYTHLAQDTLFVNALNNLLKETDGVLGDDLSQQERLMMIHATRVTAVIDTDNPRIDTIQNPKFFKYNALQKLDAIQKDAEADLEKDNFKEVNRMIKMLRFMLKLLPSK